MLHLHTALQARTTARENVTQPSSIRELLGSEESSLRGRKSLAEEAAAALRRLILLEQLPPGAAIPERDLADGLGISRTPMREALRQLEIEGLVEFTTTRRARVANPSLDELAHYLVVLGALEALAGEGACTNATNDEIAQIDELNTRMRETSSTAEPLDFFNVDMAFHRAIVRASRNPPLIETHRQYNARLWRARFISSRRRLNRDGTLQQHDNIASAIAERDRQACAQALRGHLDTAIANIRKALGERVPEAEEQNA